MLSLPLCYLRYSVRVPDTRRTLRLAIGNRLRELRFEAGISSQEKLADMAGVHRTYIGRLERGESGVTVDTLSTVVAAMGKSMADFFRTFSRPVRVSTPRRRVEGRR